MISSLEHGFPISKLHRSKTTPNSNFRLKSGSISGRLHSGVLVSGDLLLSTYLLRSDIEDP